MKRAAAVACLCIMLFGCGIAARQERAEQMAAAKAAAQHGAEECKAAYPEVQKQAVARNKCYANSASVLREYANYPDLFDQFWAYRSTVAESLQAGKVTEAAAVEMIAEKQSQLVSEEQRRNLANRSVGAQETMARAAVLSSMPVSCTKYGNTTTCY
jgi:hypothetical protein